MQQNRIISVKRSVFSDEIQSNRTLTKNELKNCPKIPKENSKTVWIRDPFEYECAQEKQQHGNIEMNINSHCKYFGVAGSASGLYVNTARGGCLYEWYCVFSKHTHHHTAPHATIIEKT